MYIPSPDQFDKTVPVENIAGRRLTTRGLGDVEKIILRQYDIKIIMFIDRGGFCQKTDYIVKLLWSSYYKSTVGLGLT